MPAREGTDCASQATVRFEDVILYFSKSEWKSLAKWQKELYWDVLKDNYEALLAVGQPVIKAEVVAWLEQCERLDIERTKESRVRDPAGNVSATNDGPSKAYCEERTGQAGSLKTLREESKEAVTQHGDTPEHLHLSARPQGDPAKDEPLLHIEHGQSRPRPACSQRPAVPPKQYKCRECGKRFRLEGLLRMHQEIATRKVSFACTACGLRFTSPFSLRRHQRTHLPAGADGEAASPRKNRLSAQQGSHAPEKLHQCSDCGDRFRGFLDVLRHQKSHEEARPRLCVQCEASFMHRIDLAMHEEGHLEEALKRHDRRRRKCLCKHAFRLHFASLLGHGVRGRQAASQDAKRPQQVEDAREQALYPCTRCGLLFNQEANLKVHCKYCSKQLLRKPPLNGSSLTALPGERQEASGKQGVAQPASEGSRGDTGLPRPPSQASSAQHSCPECGKHFASKGSLCWHKRKHKAALQCRGSVALMGGGGGSGSSGPTAACATKKLYKCQECGKSLSKGFFSVHQEFHAGLRYMCILCRKVFNFQSTAIAHRRGHVRRGELLAAAGDSKLLSHTIQKVYIPPEPRLQNPEEMGQPNNGFPTGQLPFRQEAPAEGGKLKSPRNTFPKPFRCRDCGRDFAYLARLLSHRKEHAGNFPFQCAECGKSFTSRNYLSLHWRIHTKERGHHIGSGGREGPAGQLLVRGATKTEIMG
ncbi:zinc finger protein 850-like [Zootoca vivipara]|uniref:zinc finger protein 850-like n=1 Tax=Zootoca vivipara TaxID=8524 RepID=UPI00293B981D|nr:zinc finger protein 850-like [Zootoca vivipara]